MGEALTAASINKATLRAFGILALGLKDFDFSPAIKDVGDDRRARSIRVASNVWSQSSGVFSVVLKFAEVSTGAALDSEDFGNSKELQFGLLNAIRRWAVER